MATSITTKGCSNCGKRRDYPVDRTFALYAYHGIVCSAVVASKLAYRQPITLALGQALGDHVAQQTSPIASPQAAQNAALPIDLVTWVPSHHTRRWIRGGNSVSQMAQEVASRIEVPTIDCLKTTRRLRKQAWLTDVERQKNVSGAFAARKRYAQPMLDTSKPSKIADKHVLVVDDVMTTGATTSEIARVLKRVGAARVSVAVVARAIRA